jgi:hypothetical protein
MKLQTTALLLCAWTIAGIGVLHGQQAFGSEFDLNKPIHLEGKVARLEWANPHVNADIAVPVNNGGTAIWRTELSSISNLSRAGISKNTIRVGDDVVVEGFASKAGTLRVGSASLTVKNAGITVTILPEAWHHSYAEHYDATKPARMTGKVVSIGWVNPHPVAHFTVDTPDGRSQEWLAELPPLSLLNLQGWKQSTLNSGDEIQVDGASARDGSRTLLANHVTLVSIGGTPLASPRTLLGGSAPK